MPGELFKEPTAPACPSRANGHHSDKYTFVAVDIDTTGKRLIDEVIILLQNPCIGPAARELDPPSFRR